MFTDQQLAQAEIISALTTFMSKPITFEDISWYDDVISHFESLLKGDLYNYEEDFILAVMEYLERDKETFNNLFVDRIEK